MLLVTRKSSIGIPCFAPNLACTRWPFLASIQGKVSLAINIISQFKSKWDKFRYGLQRSKEFFGEVPFCIVEEDGKGKCKDLRIEMRCN